MRGPHLFLTTLSMTDFDGEYGDWEGWGAPMRWSHYDAGTNKKMLHEAGFEALYAEETRLRVLVRGGSS